MQRSFKKEIQDEIDAAIKSVIHNSSFIGGKDISCFEESFADYQDSSHCIGVANGTDALEIAIESLDLPKNSEVQKVFRYLKYLVLDYSL